MAVEAIKAAKAKVDGEEWCWVLIWSAVMLLVTSLSNICGALISKPGSQFGGFGIEVKD